VRVYSTRGRRLRWRVALITGIAAFAIVALIYTVPELVAGRSVGGSGRATTLWGGKSSHRTSRHKGTTTSTTTSTTPSQTTTTPQQTQSTPAPQETTAVPQATTPQTTAVPPAATTPQATTPAAPPSQ
jgi:hypothetical protein